MKIEDKYWLKIIECLQSLIFPGITYYEFQSIFGQSWIEMATREIFS